MGGMDTGVDNEFGHGKVLVPVGLSAIDVQANVVLDFLIGAFGLSVGLRMVGGGEAGSDSKALEKVAHELRGKLGSAVAGEGKRESMESEDFAVVDVGSSFRTDFGLAGESVDEFGVVVGEYDDGIMSVEALGKGSNEVDSN